MKKRVLSGFLACVMAFALLGTTMTPARAAVSKTSAYRAYFDFLNEEIENMGKPIRDQDYYQMFTDKTPRNSIDDRILAAYLRDVTGDGVEELIYKKRVINTRGSSIDSEDTEWICIYSYVDGTLKRIGQNLRWCYKTTTANGDAYGYYEPDGYIGEILSSVEYPNISDGCLYYCTGSDGKPYLADNPQELVEGEFSFYAFNGSVMQKRDFMTIYFHPDWQIGNIESSTGKYLYNINNQTVSKTVFTDRIKQYSAGGSEKLVNNDYITVYNTLAAALGDYGSHYNTPSDWAVSVVETAKNAGYLPAELQKKYSEPITRREFCLMAADYYEKTTGTTITQLATFTDTDDLSVRKLGGLGVVAGVGQGRFAPNDSLSRQEAATILSRLSAALGNPLPQGEINYTDNDAIADWAKAAVGQLAAAGIMHGSNNMFSPNQPYTREQAIATLVRMDAAAVQVTSVTLDRSSLRLNLGETATLHAQVNPSDALNQQLTWSSSAPEVAVADASGMVTTKAPGSATITVTSANGKSASCTVTVAAPSEKYRADLSKTITLTSSGGSNTCELTVVSVVNDPFVYNGNYKCDYLKTTFQVVGENKSTFDMKVSCSVYAYDGTLVTVNEQNFPSTQPGKTATVEFFIAGTQEGYYRVEFSSVQ